MLVSFTEMEIEVDVWYFLELYHLNIESQESILLYVDLKMVQAAHGKPYPYLVQYDENTVGCETQLQYSSKQNKEENVSNFCGSMTTLYFLEVNVKTVESTHVFLSHVKDCPNFLDKSELHPADTRVMENVFMLVNPKYTKKLNQDKQRVLAVGAGSKSLSVYNKVEQLHEGVKIYQKPSPEENFINLGDVRLLLPALYEMAKHKLNQSFVYYCRIIGVGTRCWTTSLRSSRSQSSQATRTQTFSSLPPTPSTSCNTCSKEYAAFNSSSPRSQCSAWKSLTTCRLSCLRSSATSLPWPKNSSNASPSILCFGRG